MLLAISTHVWLSSAMSSVMSRSPNQFLIHLTLNCGHFIVIDNNKEPRECDASLTHTCLHTEHVCVAIVGVDAATLLFRYCDLKMFIHLLGTPYSFRICHSYTRWTLLKASHLRSQVVSSKQPKLALAQELFFCRIIESTTGYTFTPCVDTIR